MNKRGYKELRECINCGKPFMVLGFRLREKGRANKYCSVACYRQYANNHRSFCHKDSLLARNRDNWRCLICHRSFNSYQMITHHLDGNGKSTDLDNMVTLCRSCHSAINRLTRNSLKFGRELEETLRRWKDNEH